MKQPTGPQIPLITSSSDKKLKYLDCFQKFNNTKVALKVTIIHVSQDLFVSSSGLKICNLKY